MTHAAATQGLPDILGAFEDAWRRSPQPDITAFLPDGDARPHALIDLVHVDMEIRARHGLPFRVEDYTARFPELAGPTLLDLVAWEHALRSRGGAVVPVQEYARRFPSLAGALEARLSAGEASSTPSLPGYELTEAVGRGGMGVVWRGRHVALDRPVAVKFIRADAAQSPEARRRFEAEGRAVARLDHPGIVRVFDSGVHDGRPYLVMELVEGGSLAAALGRPLPPRLAASLARQLAEAVQHAHELGVIHRDLKPANVLLSFPAGRRLSSARLKITDFGLARLTQAERETRTGDFLGTVAYASPEQASGDVSRIGPATDVFALGVILHEMLTGRTPFQGPAASILGQVLTKDAPPPGIDPALDAIVLKALARSPADRYASARDFAAALADYLRAAPQDDTEDTMPAPAPAAKTPPLLQETTLLAAPPRRPARALWAAALAAILALAGVVFIMRTPSASPWTWTPETRVWRSGSTASGSRARTSRSRCRSVRVNTSWRSNATASRGGGSG